MDKAWHLFEARRVGTTISLWFDNKLDASATVALSSIGGNIPWTIGNAGDYPAGNIGYMAEHIVYNGDISSNDLHIVVRTLADTYQLNIVPEPNTIVFAGVGASMLLFRRRR